MEALIDWLRENAIAVYAAVLSTALAVGKLVAYVIELRGRKSEVKLRCSLEITHHLRPEKREQALAIRLIHRGREPITIESVSVFRRFDSSIRYSREAADQYFPVTLDRHKRTMDLTIPWPFDYELDYAVAYADTGEEFKENLRPNTSLISRIREALEHAKAAPN